MQKLFHSNIYLNSQENRQVHNVESCCLIQIPKLLRRIQNKLHHVNELDPQEQIQSYCELIEKPEVTAQRHLDVLIQIRQCMHFAGCLTTPQECQTYSCVSDGTACIEAKTCKDYNQCQYEIKTSALAI